MATALLNPLRALNSHTNPPFDIVFQSGHDYLPKLSVLGP